MQCPRRYDILLPRLSLSVIWRLRPCLSIVCVPRACRLCHTLPASSCPFFSVSCPSVPSSVPNHPLVVTVLVQWQLVGLHQPQQPLCSKIPHQFQQCLPLPQP